MTSKDAKKPYANANLNSSLTKPAGPPGAGLGLVSKSGLLVLKASCAGERGAGQSRTRLDRGWRALGSAQPSRAIGAHRSPVLPNAEAPDWREALRTKAGEPSVDQEGARAGMHLAASEGPVGRACRLRPGPVPPHDHAGEPRQRPHHPARPPQQRIGQLDQARGRHQRSCRSWGPGLQARRCPSTDLGRGAQAGPSPHSGAMAALSRRSRAA